MPLKDLPGYYPTIKDGGLGVLPPSLAGLFGIVGFSSKGTTAVKFAVDPDDVVDEYGMGSLVDQVQDAFSNGAWQIGIRRCLSDKQGSAGTVTRYLYGSPDSTNRATAASSITGANCYTSRKFIIRITVGGSLSTAKYILSDDGGLTFGNETKFPTPTAGKSMIDMGNGTSIEFTDGTVPSGSFVVGDEYRWETTEGIAFSAALLDAIRDLAQWKDPNTGQGFEYIYVPYPLPGSLTSNRDVSGISAWWASLAGIADELWNQETRPTWIITNAPYILEDGTETMDEWISLLSDVSAAYRHTRLSVNAGYGLLVDRQGVRRVRAIGGCVAGLAAKAKLHYSIGWVRYMAVPNSVAVYPYRPIEPVEDDDNLQSKKAGTLEESPVVPWSVTVTNGTSTYVDGGDGKFYLNTTPFTLVGTIDYDTGECLFDTALEATATVDYSYYTKDEMDKGKLALLNDARYITLRQWIGYGRVPTDDWMMAPATSDYFCIRNRRIMDEAVRMVGIANVPYTNSPGITEKDMAAYKADLSRPLEAMKVTDEDADKPIMNYKLTLRPDDNIWSNGIVHCKVEIIPTPTKKKLEAIFQLKTKIEE